MFKTYSMELAGRTLTVETGKLAELANANVLVRYGETVVMVNVTASKEPKEGIDFFPLSVDYEEKMYSVGKIPGGFTRREGKAADKAILVSRAIDRPIRPLFPKDFRNDVVVVATVLSVEPDNSPEVCAMIGASAALSISDIPFGGPTASVKVGYVDGKFIINPTLEEKAKLVAGHNSWTTHKVDRLNLNSIYLTDGPIGVRKKDDSDKLHFDYPSPLYFCPVMQRIEENTPVTNISLNIYLLIIDSVIRTNLKDDKFFFPLLL